MLIFYVVEKNLLSLVLKEALGHSLELNQRFHSLNPSVVAGAAWHLHVADFSPAHIFILSPLSFFFSFFFLVLHL